MSGAAAPTTIAQVRASRRVVGNDREWLTDEIGHPMLAQHLHSIVILQRLAIANGYGWNRYVKMVDKVMPRKGDTLEIPFPEPGDSGP